MNKLPLKIAIISLPLILSQLGLLAIFVGINALLPPIPPPIFTGTVSGYTSSYNIPQFTDYAIVIASTFVSIKLWSKYIESQ
jgi:hypothetical protein